jgi:hypothetical protein
VISLPELSRQLGDDLLVQVDMLNMPLARVAPLSGIGYPGYGPSAFRFRFADGRVRKGRRFGSPSQAATVDYVAQYLGHQGFPIVLARSGRALLTDWIEGQPRSCADCAPELLRLGGGFIRLPLWDSACEGRVIFDHESRAFDFLNRDSSNIRMLTASQNQSARVAFMRVLREFAMTHW